MARRRLHLRVLDVLALPLVAPGLLVLRYARRRGARRMPLVAWLCRRLGVLPIRAHHYEPYVDPDELRRPLSEDRTLPGIDLAVADQLALLETLAFGDELRALPRREPGEGRYHFDNSTFGPGDAEILYALVRRRAPGRIVEVGCGFSTRLISEAVAANRRDDPDGACQRTCIEPYERDDFLPPGATLVRSRVEDVPMSMFEELGAGDFLVLDTSHVIRPQGDVLHLVLEVLPRLAPGVVVHLHDVFTPRDYPDDWVRRDLRLWNEQYLVEAFLSFNPRFRVLLAVDHLRRAHPDALHRACPVLAMSPEAPETGSLWLEVL